MAIDQDEEQSDGHLHVDFGMGLVAVDLEVFGLEIVNVVDVASKDELGERSWLSL